jgi:Uma2 family endonuclease
MTTKARATIQDLYNVPENGKAEIVNGELVLREPTGFWPSRASFKITASLHEYELRTGSGFAVPDNAGFLVELPNRQSFSPDSAFYTGRPTGMKFLEGAPIFAAEVRSEGDSGPAEERRMADKRADYFAAGTIIVWDVDLLDKDVVRSHNASDPDNPKVFQRGDLADAEPALPNWRMPVDDLFA